MNGHGSACLQSHIPALSTLRQEDYEFQARLGYTARPCLNKIKQNKTLIFNIFCNYENNTYIFLSFLKFLNIQKIQSKSKN
jgi:hypothetical protein